MVKNVYQQWQELCDEFEKAKKNYNTACSPVTNAFRAVAEGGGENPSSQQLGVMNKAREELQAVVERLSHFAKENA